MSKPITYTPDLKNEASESFNRRLYEIRDEKIPQKDRDALFAMVEKVLEKSEVR